MLALKAASAASFAAFAFTSFTPPIPAHARGHESTHESVQVRNAGALMRLHTIPTHSIRSST